MTIASPLFLARRNKQCKPWVSRWMESKGSPLMRRQGMCGWLVGGGIHLQFGTQGTIYVYRMSYHNLFLCVCVGGACFGSLSSSTMEDNDQISPSAPEMADGDDVAAFNKSTTEDELSGSPSFSSRYRTRSSKQGATTSVRRHRPYSRVLSRRWRTLRVSRKRHATSPFPACVVTYRSRDSAYWARTIIV